MTNDYDTSLDGRMRLEVFDHIPAGHLAFPISDHSCEPLIRYGEVAIVDVADREPEAGALFLRKLGSAQNASINYRVQETIPHMCRTTVDGEVGLHPAWYLGAHHRPKGRDEIMTWLRAGKPGIFVDGPYLQFGDKSWMLRDTFVGRVVGILKASTAPENPVGRPGKGQKATPLLRPSQTAPAAIPAASCVLGGE